MALNQLTAAEAKPAHIGSLGPCSKGASSNQTLLEVLKCFGSCYGMSYFQLVQEADFEITEERKPVLLVFLAEAGSGVPEINCI